MLEYSLAIALIAVVVIALLQVVGRRATAALCTVDNGLSSLNALAPSNGCPLAAYAFRVPTSGANPQIIAAGTDGAMWFTEGAAKQIGRATLDGRVTNEWPVPGSPWFITAGPDGNMWYSDSSTDSIGRITRAGVVTEFPINDGNEPEGVSVGPDGNIWFTEYPGSNVGRVTMAGAVTTYPAAQAALAVSAPDGNVWFSACGSGRVGHIHPDGTGLTWITNAQWSCPNGIALGPDGNIWVTDWGNGNLSSVTMSGQVSVYTGGDAKVVGITGQGDTTGVWFAQYDGNAIGRFDVATHTFTTYPLPAGTTTPIGLVAGPDRYLWYVAAGSNQIGKFGVATS